MRQLDAKDQEILAILSKEARIPLKTLAARVNLSRSATTERVAILERAGVIAGYRADIRRDEANVVRAFLLLSLKQTPSVDILDALARHPEVRRVSSISGQIDLVVEAEASSINRLNNIRDAIAKHDAVFSVTTLVVLHRDIDRDSADNQRDD